MKTSLKKLRGLTGLKHCNWRDQRRSPPMPQREEIAQAHQEMKDIRDCYERLLSAAAATTNSVYEFSESLKEIGDCLLEKTTLNSFDDVESGKVMLTLGKVQLELQRLVDVYRSHISRTITVPSESILNELRTVEEMKSHCEEKRLAYEEVLRKHEEKGKLKSAKVDYFPSRHLQDASDEYDQEANSLLFRMRSLKQGQCRSILTQAARHHAAQLSFFKKAYLSLEAIEPYVKSIAKDYHIDYEFTGLGDDSGDDDDEYGESKDGDVDTSSSDDSELSFDDRQDHPRHYTSKPMENVEVSSPDYIEFALRKEVKKASKSAPLLSDRRSAPNYKLIEMLSSSSRKHMSYALPTPSEVKSPVSEKSKEAVPEKRSLNSYCSSPLAKNEHEKPVLRDSNQHLQSRPSPTPLLKGFSPTQVDQSSPSNTENAKRYAFSAPLTGKQWQHQPSVAASGPTGSAGHHLLSGSILRTHRGRPVSTSKLPSHTTSTFMSPPKISELYELPRPPPHLALNRHSPRFAYSGPKGTDLSNANKVVGSAAVSILPLLPPLGRSYSIPTRGQVTESVIGDIPSFPTS